MDKIDNKSINGISDSPLKNIFEFMIKEVRYNKPYKNKLSK